MGGVVSGRCRNSVPADNPFPLGTYKSHCFNTQSSLSQGRLGSAVVETNRKILTSVCFEHTKPTECPADLPGVNSEIPLVLWPHRVTEASSTMLSQQRKKVGH